MSMLTFAVVAPSGASESFEVLEESARAVSHVNPITTRAAKVALEDDSWVAATSNFDVALISENKDSVVIQSNVGEFEVQLPVSGANGQQVGESQVVFQQAEKGYDIVAGFTADGLSLSADIAGPNSP